MTHYDIVRILRKYGAVDGDFIADRLGMSMTETRKYLDALEAAKVIERRGQVVMLVGETKLNTPVSARTR